MHMNAGVGVLLVHVGHGDPSCAGADAFAAGSTSALCKTACCKAYVTLQAGMQE